MDLGDSIGAIATLLAILGAFKISRDWVNQKGSEVISNEAKEIFTLIKKLPSNTNIVLEDMMKMSINDNSPIEFDEERFINFRSINIEIIKKLELIKFKNKDKATLELIDIFEKSYENFAVHYHQSNNIILKDLLNSHKTYEKSFNNLKDEMYKYTLYKKTI